MLLDNRSSVVASAWGSLGVLLVENESDLADAMASALVDAGHDVRVARDAAEALQVISGYTPDIAILDLELPDMTCAKLVRLLRGKHALRECRFVAIVADKDADGSKVPDFDVHLHKATAGVDVVSAVAQLDPRPDAEAISV